MKLPDYIDTVSSSFADLLSTSSSTGPATSRLNFFHLPPTNPAPEWSSKTRGYFIHNLVLSQKSNVANFLQSRKAIVAGVVVDMLCTTMIDVAEELGVPSYVLFTSPASFLGAMLHCQTLHDEKNQDVAELRNAESEVPVPSFAKPVPPEVLSLVLVDRHMWLDRFLHYARDYRKAKGIIINSFMELEPHALNSFSVLSSAYGSKQVPPIYPVGPILNQGPSLNSHEGASGILKWLDDQPSERKPFSLVPPPTITKGQTSKFPERVHQIRRRLAGGIPRKDGQNGEGRRVGTPAGRAVASSSGGIRLALRMELGAGEPVVRGADCDVASACRAADERLPAGEGVGVGGGDDTELSREERGWGGGGGRRNRKGG
ncbi:UNVERIFIED_CONTAM: putative UDP-glucose flavonoid 3-O-glucosyltransferase 3 [Sesamum calycinum]|uniref:UDP-glucose flavonoid 3-O-glucosyltransferase 3 n=1 Tax=Sesamum calycinum TaxID=2727403 RepID=A0AAW2M9T5_9LAMI